MKRKDLLLLTFLLSQTAPLWAMDTDDRNHSSILHSTPTPTDSDEKNDSLNQVKGIQESLQKVIKIIEENPGQKVVLMGPTGSGKSTLINYLAGNPFVADEDYNLDTHTPLEGSKIGHGKSSTTDLPSPWNGLGHITLWDTMGLEDTEGPARNFINEVSLQSLLKGQFKILLAASETLLAEKGTGFLKLVSHITNLLPDSPLENKVAVVITKQGMTRGLNPHKKLKELLEVTPEREIYFLNPRVRNLLQYLIDHSETLIPYFPGPQTPGTYECAEHREKILKAIDSMEFLENPTVHSQNSPESILFMTDLTNNLNADIEKAITGIIKPKIVQLYTKEFDNYNIVQLNKEELEATLGAVKKALELLENSPPESMGDFAAPLDKLFDHGDLNIIKEYANTLTFLKTLKDEVKYAKESWILSLQSTIGQVHTLVVEKFNFLGNLITYYVKDTMPEKLKVICFNLITAKPSQETYSNEEEEGKIGELETSLATINISLDTLHNDSAEHMLNFVDPLGKFFVDGFDENPMVEPMKTLMFLKALKEDLSYPKEAWSQAFQPSILYIQDAIDNQKGILRLKEEKRRLEEERLRQEEAERKAEELHQAHLAELARLAKEAAIESERQRLADIEAQRKAQEEAAAKKRALEEAERRAEEAEWKRLSDLETQRQALDAIRLQVEENTRQQKENARQAEELRQQREEEAAAKLAAEKKAASERIAAVQAEVARQKQEAERLEAELQKSQLKVTRQVAKEEEDRKEAERFAVAAAEAEAEKQRLEAERKAAEDRAKAAEEGRKVAEAKAAEAEKQRLETERARVLKLKNGKVSKADYDLLPENRRYIKKVRGKTFYCKKRAPVSRK